MFDSDLISATEDTETKRQSSSEFLGLLFLKTPLKTENLFRNTELLAVWFQWQI